MPLPPNEEPQPHPPRNSAIYYPLPPSVATVQLSYLNNSLGHPEVTRPHSFHAIILTANYSLHLEPDDFHGQHVQCMHAFNATLAEIQGPEGMPISSCVGHTVILFYPGEHECKPGTDTFWNDVLRLKTGCLDLEDLSIFSSVYDRDDDDNAMARAMQNDMGVDQDEDMDLDDDDTRLALHRCYSYPPDMGPASASIQLTPSSMPKVPLEEGEIFDPLPQSNYPWQTYMCRYDTTPANEPSIETQPFPILQGSTHSPMPHSALPSTFVLPMQRIITIKLDEARAVFQVPKDYTLRMRIDEGELTALLSFSTTLCTSKWYNNYSTHVPKFRAKVFELVTYTPEEGDTESWKLSQRCEPVLLSPVTHAILIHSALVQLSPYANPTLSCTRTYEREAGTLSRTKPLHDSPEPMSGYNSDSRAPSTLSSHSSMPSLCSYSDSNDSDDAYSPLSLDELNWSNMKSKYFAVEPIRLGKETKAALADLPNEPWYFVHRTSGANEDSNNTAFTYITCQHTDEWHPAHKFMPTENGPISPHPFSIVKNQYVYQVLETFHGPINNSPLQHVHNELVNLFNPSYDSLRGVDEYKISTLALKIYDLIMELDVRLDQWRETQPRISQAELEKIHITIFRAYTERYILEDTGDWGRYLIMQGVVDMPASMCIIAKDSSEAEIAPTPRVLIFLKPGEMMPGREHIADVLSWKSQKSTSIHGILSSATFASYGYSFIGFLVSFHYLEPSFPTYLQGFNHRCMHVDSKAGGLCTTCPPRNLFLSANEDELLYHAMSLFEFEGCGKLANCIHYAWGVRPILSEQAHVLFKQGFVKPINFYDAEGRHCAFRGDELDLQYYDEVD
ncbi:hypothetical protein ARMGADRAFT_1029888 [Armillaria gallica]|uniref:Uncharacterized protein n=1 Tax=Armillaria gallica TaxID=47427 RepID=A0A2H3DFQ5_ARMGA|nr:hypothetical protein ARMGADRAFT_1029888 [Armillaria gallica]